MTEDCQCPNCRSAFDDLENRAWVFITLGWAAMSVGIAAMFGLPLGCYFMGGFLIARGVRFRAHVAKDKGDSQE